MLPPPELLAVNSPDACEACPNHVTERGCPHLQNQAWEDKYLMRILHEPFRLRDAFRAVRGGESWQ